MCVQPHIPDVLSSLARSLCILGILAFLAQFTFLTFSSHIFHITWKYSIWQMPSSSPSDLEWYSTQWIFWLVCQKLCGLSQTKTAHFTWFKPKHDWSSLLTSSTTSNQRTISISSIGPSTEYLHIVKDPFLKSPNTCRWQRHPALPPSSPGCGALRCPHCPVCLSGLFSAISFHVAFILFLYCKFSCQPLVNHLMFVVPYLFITFSSGARTISK